MKFSQITDKVTTIIRVIYTIASAIVAGFAWTFGMEIIKMSNEAFDYVPKEDGLVDGYAAIVRAFLGVWGSLAGAVLFAFAVFSLVVTVVSIIFSIIYIVDRKKHILRNLIIKSIVNGIRTIAICALILVEKEFSIGVIAIAIVLVALEGILIVAIRKYKEEEA